MQLNLHPEGLLQLIVLKGHVRVKSVLLDELERMENESRLTEDTARRNRNQEHRYASLRFL